MNEDEARAAATEYVRQSNGLVERIRPILAGQDPAAVGAALAQLVSIFIAGHHPAIRDEQIDLMLGTVRQIVPVDVAEMIAMGRAPANWGELVVPSGRSEDKGGQSEDKGDG